MRVGDIADVPGAVGRQPVVLAFLAHVDAIDPGPRIRAELRGLGAAMVVVSPAGTFLFRADDDAEQLDARAAWSRAHRSGLFFVDEDRIVRFAYEWDDDRGLAEIEDALATAGRAMLDAPRLLGRREAVTTALVGAFVLAFVSGCTPKGTSGTDTATTTASADAANDIEVTLDVNGAARKVKVDVRTSLLDALRERMALPGTKKGCDHGQCGACTVHVDDRRVLSCLLLAVQAEGSKITTIEGLAKGEELHPMQAAFVTEDALQCGYCTPGQIMSAIGLLKEKRRPNESEIRQGMSGNICRCGAYTNIVAAIQRASETAG